MLFCFGRENTKKRKMKPQVNWTGKDIQLLFTFLMKVSSASYVFLSYGNTAGMVPQYSKWSQHPQYCIMRQACWTDHASDVQHCWVIYLTKLAWWRNTHMTGENKEISRVETASTASWKISNCGEFYKAAQIRRGKSANLISCQAKWQIKTYDLLTLPL